MSLTTDKEIDIKDFYSNLINLLKNTSGENKSNYFVIELVKVVLASFIPGINGPRGKKQDLSDYLHNVIGLCRYLKNIKFSDSNKNKEERVKEIILKYINNKISKDLNDIIYLALFYDEKQYANYENKLSHMNIKFGDIKSVQRVMFGEDIIKELYNILIIGKKYSLKLPKELDIDKDFILKIRNKNLGALDLDKLKTVKEKAIKKWEEVKKKYLNLIIFMNF